MGFCESLTIEEIKANIFLSKIDKKSLASNKFEFDDISKFGMFMFNEHGDVLIIDLKLSVDDERLLMTMIDELSFLLFTRFLSMLNLIF